MSIPFLSVRPKAIKLKVIPKYPADFHDGVGTDAVINNGIFSVNLDYADFPPYPPPPIDNNQQVLLWDQVKDTYSLIPAHYLGGDIWVDAPNDGHTYGRLNGAWSQTLDLTNGGTVTGNVTFNGTNTVGGPTTFTGTTALNGVNTVGGATTFNAATTFNNPASFTSSLSSSGSATFTGTIAVPTPTLAGQAANKSYVDSSVSGAAGNANPLMDGTAAPGVSALYSRQDHVHPTDTSRAANAPFVASGPSHAQGLVPDPGSVAGAAKFLREDATWQVPAGGGGGGANVYIQDTAPVGATAGSLWWSSATGQLFVYYNDGTSSQWVFASSQAATTVMRGYISGLTLSTVGSSTTFSVATGIASDATNVDMIALVGALSKTTSAWAAGTGNGALDTGSIAASTWYHVFVIKNPSTLAVDVLISTLTTPSLPSGYTLFRRVGSMLTNSSSQWTAFVQTGNDFLWVSPVRNLTNSTTAPSSGTLLALTVPTGVSVKAIVHGMYSNTVAAGNGLAAWSPNMGSTPPVGPALWLCQVINQLQGGEAQIWTNTNGQIYYAGAGSGDNVSIATTGWLDPRNSDVTISANNAIVPVNVVRGYLSGLILSTAGSSTTFSVAPGIAADTTAFDMMNLPNALNKTTSAWAVGSGNGALDTGSIAASTWYHVHLIKRIDSGLVDVLVSLSATSPSLPLGYTLSRRIGSMKTNASSQWIKFLQTGNVFMWDVAVAEISGGTLANSTTATVTLLGVPTGLKVLAFIVGGGTSTGAPPWNAWDADQTGGSTNFLVLLPSANFGSFNTELMVNASAQFKWQNGGGVSITGISLSTLGWTDFRGADVAMGGVVPAIPVVQGHLQGMTLSTAGSSATFSVAQGTACDTTAVAMMTLGAATSKTTAAWAAGSGNGALDTGAIAASTWYHVHVIKNPTTNAVDVLVSLSATAPILPSGFTLFRRIGSMLINASSQWTAFVQVGNEFRWAVQVNNVSGANPGSTPTLATVTVPTGVIVNALLHCAFFNSTLAGRAFYLWSPLASSVAPGVSGSYSLSNPVAAQPVAGDFNVLTNTSGQVYYTSDAASGPSCNIVTYGWTDTRGRDN